MEPWEHLLVLSTLSFIMRREQQDGPKKRAGTLTEGQNMLSVFEGLIGQAHYRFDLQGG